jgi:mRNA interferase MazF
MGVAVTRAARARGDVHLVRLDPTLGSEIQKTRPCLVVSRDELNQYLRTVIVAPMTAGGRAYPWRVPCRFQRRSGFVALDQLRTVDAERLLRRLGRLTPQTVTIVLNGYRRCSPNDTRSGQWVLEGGARVSAEASRRLACDARRVVMRHEGLPGAHWTANVGS